MSTACPRRRRTPGLLLAIMGLVAAALLPGCAPRPPVIESLTISPQEGDEGGFVVVSGTVTIEVKAKYATRVDFLISPTGTGMQPIVLHSDTTPKDGFSCRWLVPDQNILAHVWAVAYNKRGDTAESRIIGVYHEVPPPKPCPPGG